MNAPVLLAQLAGSTTQTPPSPKNLKLEKPQNGQAISVHLDGNTKLDFADIASEKLTFVKVGEKLIILFDNQSTVTVDPVFDSMGKPLTDLAFDMGSDRTLTGEQFAQTFPITTDQSVLPAAGGATGPTGGANFGDATVGALAASGARLALLTGEDTGGGFDNLDDGTPNPSPIPGGVTAVTLNEDGFAEGNLGGTGDTGGTATSVTGSLNVDFGTDGSNRSFAFSLNQPTLAGLTSDGQTVQLAFTTVNGQPVLIGYVGGDFNAAANQVFTVSLDASSLQGNYTFTLLRPLDHPIGGTEDTINLSINVIATDGSGDTVAVTIPIGINDDTPVIGTPADAALTDPLSGNPATQTGSLGISWGADRYNDHVDGGVSATTGATGDRSVVFANTQVTATGDGATAIGTLTSHGETVHYVLLENGTVLVAYTGATAPTSLADLQQSGTPSGEGEGGEGGIANNVVFVVTLSDASNSGSYVVTQYRSLDHDNGSATFQNIDLAFNFTATDSDGDTVNGTLHAVIADTVPVVTGPADASTLSEGNGETPPSEGGGDMPSLLVVGGSFTPKDTGAVSLHIDWRSDNQNPTAAGGAHDRSVTFTAATQTALENLGLTSDGATIIYTISAGGTLLTATTAATEGHSARTIFTVQLSDSGNGSYDFTLLDNLDHRGSSEGSQALTFGFIATDSDGDSTVPASFTVNITDETPSFTSEGVAPQFVDEEGNAGDTYASGDLAGEAKTATASLNIAWGADDANNVVDGGFTGSAGDRSVVFASNAVSSLQGQNLTSNGVALQYVLSTDGTTLTAYQGSGRLDGDKVFAVTLSDQGNGSYNFTMLGHLDHPISGVEDDLTPVFSFTARDGDGDAISSSFSVTINDDAPVVPVTTPVNLIINGDFSAGDWSGVASWGNYSTNVTGWTITGDRLERVNSGYLGATLPNGGHMVDLEASPGDLTLSQTVGGMTTGQTYHLSFAIGEATGPYGAHLEVYWNGTLVGSYSPQTGAMQTIDLTVVADGTSNTLSFKETGAIDNSGTFLANVSLTAAAVGIVDEDGLANGVAGGVGDVAGQVTVVTNALNISWGSDNGNSVVDGGITGLPVNGDRAVTFDASNVSALSALGLTHNGTVITYQISADGTKLIASAGEQEIFHVALSDVDTGSYTFTLTGAIDHPLHSVEDNVTLNFAVRATDSDGDSIHTSFAVLVNDDAPSIGKIGDQTIAESTSTEFSNTFLTQTLSDVSLNISWGADDNNSGAFNRSVAFDAALAGTAPSGLTSNGVALIYVLSADGTGLTAYRFDGTNYIGVGGGNLGTSPSDAARVFSVQLSDLGNGSYTFKLYDNLDHKTGDGTSLNLSFGFTATDSDGDTTPISNFTVVVTDNVPLLVGNADVGALTETGLPAVSSTFGNLGIDWNADDRGSAHLEFAKDSNGLAIVPQGLTSDGVALAYIVRLAANGVDEELVAYKVGDTVDHPVFIVALNGLVNPAFAATLFQNLDHVGAGNDSSLTLTFTAHAIDGDGDTVDRTFTITVADTKATVGTPESARADEDAFGNPAGLSLITDSAIDTDNNNRTVGGKLNISWGSDDSNTVVNGGITGAPVAGDRAVTFDASNITTLLGLNLTHNGAALSYQISADGQTLTAKANGEEIFNVKLSDVDSGSYIFTLTRNLDHADRSGEDNLPLSFKFNATDSDGDVTAGNFTVEVNDDSPVIGTPASAQADDSSLGNVAGLSIITDSSVDTDNSSKTVGGKLNISWGADDGNNLGNVGITGAASVNGDRAVTFDVNATNTALNALHLTHDGTSLVYSYSSGNSLLTAKANGATVFTVQLSDDGSGKYIFTLVDSLDHPTHGTADNLNLTFSFIATDSDGDKATSTFAVAVNDDLPTIGSPAASRVDEDDLSAGNHDGLAPITDVTVDTDSSRLTVGGKLGISWGADDGNSSVNGGINGASVNGDRAVTFDSATTAALTSQHLSQGGVELTYVISNNGTVLKGMAGTAEVFSVTLSDQNDGSYIFTLKGKLDHPDTTTEDNIDLTFNFTATDSDGDTATSSFKVTVNDDAPTAAGETATVAESSPALGTGNIILAFDRSGSMNDDPDGSGGFSSRLALAKAAAINLLNTSNADQVLIVTFSDNATSSSWMTKAQAIAYINSNSFPGTNGGTDYDNATAAIQGATIPSGGTSVYFFTDGQPTGSGGLNSTERAAWESFLQSKSMTSYAVGVGNGIGANDPDLNDVAYPGSPLIITTANDPALLGTITPTLPTSVTGNILSNDHFGADGGRILSITIGSVTYTWNGASTITKSGGETGTIPGNALSIDTGINGHLNFNFSTGAWSYSAPAQLVTNTTETFSYTLIDGDKDTAGANLVISVTAVNDAPTNTVPTARVVNEDTAIVFSSGNSNAISIADADHNGGNETVTLSVLHGNLTLSGLSGLTVTGNGTGNVTVTGTVAAINSALNGLSYLPSNNYNGADTLTIVTNDNGNNGVGGAKSDTDTIAITINPVNDAPVITPETREVSYIENGNDLKLLSNAVITDPDNPTSLNGGFISVTLGNTVAGDQLQIADNSNVRLQGNNVQVSNGFGGWTTIGTISAGGFGGTSVTIALNANADVADVQTVVRSLAFYSSSDNPTGVDRTATVTFNDGGHDGSGGPLSDTSTVTIHVTPVNDVPVIAGGSERSVSVAENTTGVTTVTSTDPDGGTPTYSILQTSGTDWAKFTINPVTGALSFNAAPDYENPTDVGGTNGNNTYEVDVRVSDGNGGTAVQTINVTVTNVNEAPVLAPDTNSISYTENGNALKLMPNASVTDPDSPSSFVGGSITASLGATAVSGDQLVFAGSSGVSLVGNVIWVGFTVVGTVSGYGTANMTISLAAGATDGNVETVLKALAYQSTSENPTGADRTATVTFNDGGNDGSGPALSDTSTVTIHVTPVNDAPLAINDTGSATEKGGVANATGGSNATGNVLSNDSDVDDLQTSLVVSGVRVGTAGSTGTVGSTLTGAHGLLVLNANGTYTYVIDETDAQVQALNVNGTITDTFTYTVRDPSGATDTAQLTITINGANDAPVATDDTGSATEKGGVSNGSGGVTATGNVRTNDGDVDNTTSSLVISAVRTGGEAGTGTAGTVGSSLAGQYGSLKLNSDGSYTYTVTETNSTVQALNVGQSVTETFTYTVRDAGGLTDTAQLVITINGANDAAVITGNVTGSVTEASGVANATPGIPTATGDLNATDVDNAATFTVQSNVATSYGTFSIDADGAWTYNLNNANSTVQGLNNGGTLHDLITVTTADGTSKQIDVTINGANDAAVVSSATVNLTETNSAASISATGSLTITDVDNPATFVAQNNVSGTYGKFSITSAGAWTYTANNAHDEFQVGQTYTDTFTVSAADGTQTSVTIKIAGTNDAPVLTVTNGVSDDIGDGFQSGGYTGSTGSPNLWTTNWTEVGDNNSSSNGDIRISSSGGNSYVRLGDSDGSNSSLQRTVDLSGTSSATLTFDYRRVDLDSSSDQVFVQVSTDGVNFTQIAVIGGGNFDDNGFLSASIDLSAYRSSTTTIRFVASGGLGDNDYVYLDNVNISYSNEPTFTENGSAVAIISNATLSDVDDANMASATVVLTNKQAGDQLWINSTALSNGSTGTVNGVSYLVAEFAGAITITFSGAATKAAYELAIEAVKYASTSENPSTTDRSFQITVNDGHDNSNTGTAVVHVIAVNDAPLAVNDTGTATEKGGVANGTSGSNATGNVLSNDTDAETASASLVVSSIRTGTEAGSGTSGTVGSSLLGTYGTLTLNADGTYSYVLNDGLPAVQALNVGGTLTETFTYTVKDTGNLTDTAQLVITINGANDAAVISGTTTGGVIEAGGVDNGTVGTPTATGTLTDADVDNAANTFTAVTTATATAHGYGTYTMTSGGAWTFTLDNSNVTVQALSAAQTLTDTFTVKTTDGTPQVVTVTIHGANDAPVANDDNLFGAGVPQNAITTFSTSLLLANDTDAEGDTLKVTYVSEMSGAGAKLTLDKATGMITYDPATYDPADQNSIYIKILQQLAVGQTHTDSFTYVIDDGHGALTSAIGYLTIIGTNDAPVITSVASDAKGTVVEDATVNAVSGQLTATDIDNDATQSWTISGTPAYGTIAIDATGKWTYTLNNSLPGVQALAAGQNVAELFTATVTDEHGATAIQTVTVTVTGTNDAPVLTGDHTATVAEGGTYTIVAADLGFSDPDDVASGVTFTASSLVNGTLQVNGVTATTFTGTELAAGQVKFFHNGGEASSASFQIKVEDGNEDNSTPVNQAFTFTVTPVNDGVATISITDTTQTATAPKVGDVLNATLGADPDGAESSIVYHWLRDGTEVSSGTSSSYTLGSSDAGHAISAYATYIDGQGFHDTTATTAQTVAVISANNAPAFTTSDVAGGVVEDAGTTQGATLIQNGNFENYDYANSFAANWTPSSSGGFWSPAWYANHTSSGFLGMVEYGGNESFSQTAIPTTAGTSYLLDFWVLEYSTTATLYVQWNGNTIAAASDGTGGWKEYKVTVTGTGNDTLTFIGNDPNYTSMRLDDVSVTKFTANTTQTASGVLHFTDEAADTHTASFTQGSALNSAGTAYLGTFSLDSVTETSGTDSIGWHFSASNSALQSLAAGQTVTQTYEVAVTDDHANTSIKEVTVTLTGVNDAPVFGSGTATGVVAQSTLPTGNLLTNGGFDTGNTSGWTVVAQPNTYAQADSTFNFASGNTWNFDVYGTNPATREGIATISQSISTVAGQHYLLAFDYAGAYGLSPDSTLKVSWAGSQIISLSGIQNTNTDSGVGSPYTYLVTGDGNSDALTFAFDAKNQDLRIDSVSLVRAEVAQGSISFSDVDLTDNTHTVSVASKTVNPYGYMTATVDEATDQVNWTFVVKDSEIAGLAVGQSVNETYTLTLDDHHGGVVTKDVTVTVNGLPGAPVITGITAASDSGAIGDNITNDTTPSFVGTAQAFSTVTVKDGATVLGTTTADANGAWTFTPDAGHALSSTTHTTITATATDIAGHVSAASANYTLTIDTLAPSSLAGTTLDLTDASDSAGASNSDNITKITTPTITVGHLNGIPMSVGDVIQIIDTNHGNAVVGSYTVQASDLNGSSQWNSAGGGVGGVKDIVLTTLDDGAHNFTVQLVDKAGNTGTQGGTLTVTEDTTAPSAPSISVIDNVGNIQSTNLADGAFSDDTQLVVHVSLTGTGAVAGDTVQLSSNTTALGSAVTLTGANITAGFVDITTPTLTNGSSYNLRAATTDVAGNVGALSASGANDVTIDTTKPTVSGEAITSATGIQNGYLNAGDVVSITVNMSEVVTVTGTPQLGLNINGTTVQANYASGSGSSTLVFTYTVVAGQNDSNGISINTNGLSLNGGTIRDAAGNDATLTAASVTDNSNYKVDTTAPTLAFTTADNSQDLLSGTVSDSGSGMASVVATRNSGGTSLGSDTTFPGGSWSISSTNFSTGQLITVVATDLAGNTTSATKTSVAPAGTSGEAINLALTAPTDHVGLVSLTIAGLAAGWTLSEGTLNTDGTWSILTSDPSSLSVTSPDGYTGALVLHVTETWTNADGSTGTAYVADNVEAYAKGAPIFAWSGDDTLTASSGADTLVFANKIGTDVVHHFDTVHDKIDLIGFAGFSSFADVQAHLGTDAAGNAIITLGDGQTITLNGVSAASLSADDFLFNETPLTHNAGDIVLSNGALMPFSGVLDNTGSIHLASTGGETAFEIVQRGLTLLGGGTVTLSDSSSNVIFGSADDVTLTNVDNTISGAGQLGDGHLTLVNEGTIVADGSNALVIDTGDNAVINTGTLEATGTGGLNVHSDVVNNGLVWANGGDLDFDGNVTGSGSALLSGHASIELGGVFNEHILFDGTAEGTLVLDHSADFGGLVSGFDGNDTIDLADILGSTASVNYTENAQGTGGVLTVTDGAHTANIAFAGQYSTADFHLSSDASNHVLVQLESQARQLTNAA
ncbi:T1SS-143 repeat domain-containing protein [Tardiphaga sp. 215_C5_N2_1]|uniref:T1SS-143 repeat domain-containing protein n=1 Tax=Tardiphaga sp. 215_C5_N2_1 TaxID=3240774 RepID=UPI003F8A4D54